MRHLDQPTLLTPGRALLLALMARYALAGDTLTREDLHPLAYLAQATGARLRLRFIASARGPHAEALERVLALMHPDLLAGYHPSLTRPLSPTALGIARAQVVLQERRPWREAYLRAAQLIEGFETPHGLWLLSALHWINAHAQDASPETRRAQALERVSAPRPERVAVAPHHIDAAWRRIASLNAPP